MKDRSMKNENQSADLDALIRIAPRGKESEALIAGGFALADGTTYERTVITTRNDAILECVIDLLSSRATQRRHDAVEVAPK